MKPVKLAGRFCPKCGGPILSSATLCKSCSTPEFSFKDIHLTLCNSCHSYQYKNKWTAFKDIDGAVAKIATGQIKAKIRVHPLDDKTREEMSTYKAGVKRDFTIEVSYKGGVYAIPASYDITLCTKCAKKGTKYFESILQVRRATPEIIAFIKNDIIKQHTKGIYINKEERLNKYSDEDIDFSITDQTYAKVLAEKLKHQFGAQIKKNAQLFSLNWQTSKNIYRLNVLVEIPGYTINDGIKDDGEIYVITSLSAKINVINLKTQKKTALSHGDKYQILKPITVQVIKKYPEVEVLDPQTYYPARLMNPTPKLEINQKVKAIIDGSEAWLV